MSLKRLISATAVAASSAACSTLPDLTVSQLSVVPAEARPGDEISISSTVKNEGSQTAAQPDGAPVPLEVEIGLYANDSAPTPVAAPTSWPLDANAPLRAGEEASRTIKILAPSRVAAGHYALCADVDLDDRLAEANEKNNGRCTDLTLLDGPPALADLIVTKAKFLGVEKASAKIAITVRNVGLADAPPFAVMAFDRAPRRPVLLTNCALTEAMRDTGSIPSCGGLETTAPLAPGKEAEWTGYVTFLYGGSQIPTTPVGPPPDGKLETHTINIMADGCFPPTDDPPLPSWCRVDEIDEINNFAGLTVKSPK